MQLVFELPQPTLAVLGSPQRFPVHRVYCVGRNYADHAREMGGDPTREPPFFFMKPADAAFTSSEGVRGDLPGLVPFPPATSDFEHEVELVVAIGSAGRSVGVEEALSLVWGYGVGVDLTRRDLQADAKAGRRPWDLSKGFDASAPMSLVVPVDRVGHPSSGHIELRVNEDLRQIGNLADQIWNVQEVISHLSRFVELKAGDLIMTGTPAGVAALHAGDRVVARIAGLPDLDFSVGPKP